jgi:hypothetical protein
MRAIFRAWVGEEFTARVEKLSRWLLYGVVIGLLPFAFPVVKAAIIGPHMTLTLLFGRGDLFLVTATLVAASFGDLIAGGKERALGKIWVGFFCIVDFVLCLIWFGAVSDALDVHEKYDSALTAMISLAAFGLAVISLCFCAFAGRGGRNSSQGQQCQRKGVEYHATRGSIDNRHFCARHHRVLSNRAVSQIAGSAAAEVQAVGFGF